MKVLKYIIEKICEFFKNRFDDALFYCNKYEE